MKNQVPKNIEKCRVTTGAMKSTANMGFNGLFIIPYANVKLAVICSDQGGWDHVSVSLSHRVPSWEEMSFIKRLFFDPEETVVQFHPPESKYINFCKTVLHLWRKHGKPYELPPARMV